MSGRGWSFTDSFTVPFEFTFFVILQLISVISNRSWEFWEHFSVNFSFSFLILNKDPSVSSSYFRLRFRPSAKNTVNLLFMNMHLFCNPYKNAPQIMQHYLLTFPKSLFIFSLVGIVGSLSLSGVSTSSFSFFRKFLRSVEPGVLNNFMKMNKYNGKLTWHLHYSNERS